MAKASTSISFDQLVQEGRKKREAEQLAQEIFGGARRSRTPLSARAKPAPAVSLASRIGIAKRAPPPPRSDSAPARVTRPPPPRTAKIAGRPTRPVAGQPATKLDYGDTTDGYVDLDAPVNIAAELNIRGAAGGPYVVVAQNFAPGTTAADIEHVMIEVGGQITECRLVASNPTVIAEMTFVEKSGADAVIATFNNKKADGRTLHVYFKANAPPRLTHTQSFPASTPAVSAVPIAATALPVADESMETDDLTDSREAENRLREERRGPRLERGGHENDAREVFPSGPRGDRMGFGGGYYRGPHRAEPVYQDGRYGVAGGDRYGPRGGYRDEGRMYSDSMRRGGGGGGAGGQRWRP